MDILNNREIATVVWLTIFFMWSFTRKTVRDSFKQVVNSFLSKFILVPLVLMVAYIFLLICGLDSIGLWEDHQTKNVVFWFFTAAIYSFFQITKAADDKYYFSNAIKDNLKIIVLLQFIVNVYSFNLWVELILVPTAAFIALMLAFSQSNEKYKVVEKLFSRATEIIGLIIILYTGYKLVTDFGEFGKVKTIYDLLVPTLLSLLLLPFLYLLATFNNYQSMFIRLRLFIRDENLLKYAKLSAIWKFHFRFSKFVRWADSIAYLTIKSKEDVDSSFDVLFQQFEEEKNPPKILPEEGWSPHIAKDYLKPLGLHTGFYKNVYDDLWHASSAYLDLGKGIIPNNLAYYVEGERRAAKSLSLKLNINDLEYADCSHDTFTEFAKLLFEKALGKVIPDDINVAITNRNTFEKVLDNIVINVIKTNQMREEGLYDYTLKLDIF